MPRYLGGRGPVVQRKCDTCRRKDVEHGIPLSLRSALRTQASDEPRMQGLALGSPHDTSEHEADRMAEAVM
ncbi:MAG TPA: hypothetical protein VEU33_48115, partial [Archangium sp.]|nr:hypothetical protein [Archangium sp.]